MGVKELSQTNHELFELCRKNDLEKLKVWLALKKSKRPRTPLNFLRPTTPNAAWLTIIRDPSSQYTALHAAALHGFEGICRVLLEADPNLCTAKDKRGCIPLHLAAWNGHAVVVKMLLDMDTECVDWANNAQETALHLSAQHGHSKIVQILLDTGADAHVRNARCETPLDIAARTGHASVCKMMVTVCPELALQSAVECSSTAENGRSAPLVVYPVHSAARHSHIQCLQMLRLAGFDMNYVTDEGSALHVAAMFGQVDAVKYLIEEGINPHIKDSRGRTVLEMLEEHETQKASDLTQVIQSRDGWGECRRLIEDYIFNHGNLNSSSDSGIDRPDGDRSPKDVVWRPLPGNSSIINYSNITAPESSPSSSSGIYHPPSLNAEIVNVGDEDRASTISISTRDDFDVTSQTSPSLSSMTYGSRPEINRGWTTKTLDGRIPRFPITSPNTKARHHSSKRVADTLPAKMSAYRTNTMPVRASILPNDQCVYRAPPGVEGKRVIHTDGTSYTYNPALAYDNVPNNRQWNHQCADSHEIPQPKAIRQIPVNVRSDGTQTLPTARARTTRPSALQTFASIQEDSCSPRSSQERELSRGSTNSLPRSTNEESKLRNTCVQLNGSMERRQQMPSTKPPVPKITARWSRNSEREDSIGLPNGLDTREGSRASTVTFACSTLERSHSPPTRYQSGRAPLALPEELTGSTSTSIMSSSMSPERTVKEFDKDASLADESSLTINESETITERLPLPRRRSIRDGTSSDTGDVSFSSFDGTDEQEPPSPYTSQTKIYDALYGQDFRSRVQCLPSPSSQCSDSTVASSCSLPVISQISTTPPSVASPRKERMEQQFSTDESSNASIEVKMRPTFQDNKNDLSKKSVRRFDEIRSLNENAEWRKINAIMESYGGAICRESVFASDYEPQVAVYLRDRRSRALTIQMREAARLEEQRRMDDQSQHNISTSKSLSISDWLNVVVGIPNPKAYEVGNILETNGFDRSTQLKNSLDRSTMTEMGIDKSIQHQILSYLDTLDKPKENANHYNYVSDWLCSLELTDYLGNFVNAGFRSMLIVRAAELNAKRLNEMGITLIGHVRRLISSLVIAQDEERRATMERKASMKKQVQSDGRQNNSPVPSIKSSDSRPDLSKSGVTFSAHYLGSMEISNIDGTEESRRAMSKLKKGIREIAKVPQVQLEISVRGVNVLDAISKNVTASHEICRIQIVCQDERDLNCFAYITQEGERNFAHVFCVLTADVATEIIMTLGNAFDMAYNLQSGRFTSLEEIADI